MELYAYHLENSLAKEEIELRLGIRFERVLEKAVYARLFDGYLFLTAFNCAVFIDVSKEAINETTKALGGKLRLGYINQDYKIEIDPTLQSAFHITNDKLYLKNSSDSQLFVAALIVSQSVGLEKYESVLDSKLSTSKHLLSQRNKGYFGKRKSLIELASSLALLRHEIIVDMHLLDKPNILWDDEVAERLYNELSMFFELKERFEIVEFKLGLLKDDIMFLTDILNHKKSEFLEWIIIWLITFEIVMGLYEMVSR
jgi:required for meiotic nuclear division protein 1